jgi:hypothetical protein
VTQNHKRYPQKHCAKGQEIISAISPAPAIANSYPFFAKAQARAALEKG